MKKLKVPFIASLDTMDLPSVLNLMEQKAQRESIDCINWDTYPYKPIIAVDVARSESSLYIRYFVKGFSLKALYKEDGSPVYTDSCVEFFMKKEEDSNYYNFEFNCIGTCDAAYRQSRDIKESLTPEQYASIRRYSTVGDQTFAEKTGIHSWELLVAIPFNVMGLDAKNLPEKIRGNFYKCADDTEMPHFVSWSPIHLPTPNFHCPDFFGEIYF